MKSSLCDSLESLVSNEVMLVPLAEQIPLERGHQRGVPSPPLEIVILPLLAHLAWKRLQIDTDLLLIITSTADELSSGTNIDDLEHRFQRCKIWPHRFKESSVRAYRIWVLPQKRAISATVD